MVDCTACALLYKQKLGNIKDHSPIGWYGVFNDDPILVMRKQLDPRIPILINNNVQKNHRSFVVLVGDKGRDQVCQSAGPIIMKLTKISYHSRL